MDRICNHTKHFVKCWLFWKLKGIIVSGDDSPLIYLAEKLHEDQSYKRHACARQKLLQSLPSSGPVAVQWQPSRKAWHHAGTHVCLPNFQITRRARAPEVYLSGCSASYGTECYPSLHSLKRLGVLGKVHTCRVEGPRPGRIQKAALTTGMRLEH